MFEAYPELPGTKMLKTPIPWPKGEEWYLYSLDNQYYVINTTLLKERGTDINKIEDIIVENMDVAAFYSKIEHGKKPAFIYAYNIILDLLKEHRNEEW